MLDREQWIEAVHALMQPTRGEFWAEVAAAQPPDDDEGEDLPDVRWTGEGGDFFISRSQGWLGVDIDGEESVAWLEEWDPETLRSLSEPVSWKDDDDAFAEFARVTPRKFLRRGEPRVAIRIWEEGSEPDQVTLSLDQWAEAVKVLTDEES